MTLVEWLAWGSFAVNMAIFGCGWWSLWRCRRLQRNLDADRAEATAELDVVAQLHFTLTWIFVRAARWDSLPWWRMWSASMEGAMTEAATETPDADTRSRPAPSRR
jgi:hypothetical protein